jgi:hypothetical protein
MQQHMLQDQIHQHTCTDTSAEVSFLALGAENSNCRLLPYVSLVSTARALHDMHARHV